MNKMKNQVKIIYMLITFAFCFSIIFVNNSKFHQVYSDSLTTTNSSKTKLVYHLSSDEPWRATIALLDSQTMLSSGYNVTLMLSIEGVQMGVKHPHQYLGLNPLTNNVTNFMSNGGNVIICEVCLKIAGYKNSDIIDGAIIGTPEIMSDLLNKTTVVDY
jgi:predicted peroxiredoxin